jgi:hypothetical protein
LRRCPPLHYPLFERDGGQHSLPSTLGLPIGPIPSMG